MDRNRTHSERLQQRPANVFDDRGYGVRHRPRTSPESSIASSLIPWSFALVRGLSGMLAVVLAVTVGTQCREQSARLTHSQT